jgi:hypothetical protein
MEKEKLEKLARKVTFGGLHLVFLLSISEILMRISSLFARGVYKRLM